MRFFSLMAGCMAALCAAIPAKGATITFADLRKDASLGVHVHPTGPTDIPVVTGLIEVYGASDEFLANSVTSRFYSGFANFDEPANKITFDVSRVNDSGWNSRFTLAGMDHHKRVALTSVELQSLGDITQVTISAPAIDQVRWTGTDWIFHPYVIRDVRISYASAGAVPSRGSPASVGSPVPEPGSCAIFGVIGAGALLRRRR